MKKHIGYMCSVNLDYLDFERFGIIAASVKRLKELQPCVKEECGIVKVEIKVIKEIKKSKM